MSHERDPALTPDDRERLDALLDRLRVFLDALEELCREHDVYPSSHYGGISVYFHPIEYAEEENVTLEERIERMHDEYRHMLTKLPLGQDLWKKGSYPDPNQVAAAKIVEKYEDARPAEGGELCHRHQLQDVEAVVVVEGEGPLCRTCARKLGYVPDSSG